MRAFAWFVLTLVFVDELLAMAAAYVWGHHTGGLLLGLLAMLVVVAVWATFASPKAPYGTPLVRRVVKAVVFGCATVGLLVAGHPLLALAFLVFSVVVNALAEVPAIREVAEQPQTHPQGGV